MLRYLCILLLTLFMVACSPKTLPTVSVKTIHGKTLQLPPTQRWLLINYWAAWCHPCREEIPTLNQFAKQSAPKVLLVAVNYMQPPLKAQKQLQQRLHIHYPLLSSNPASALHLPTVSVLPTTFVIDPQGHLRHILRGPQSLAELQHAVSG